MDSSLMNPDECGFHAFRTGFPGYSSSIFRTKTEIVTDGNGKIVSVTNPDRLLWAKIPECAEGIQILEVGPRAFCGCRKLREISFSDNLEIVGEEAFSSLRMLSYVRLGASVFEMGDGAFASSGLKSFVFPRSLEYVPARTFIDNTELESVTLHSGIRKIGILAFSGTSSLVSVDIPYGIREISEGCFMKSGLRSIYLPRTIDRIASSAFSSCFSLERIFYDGTEDDFRRISFGRNWRRGMSENSILYLKDEDGHWYNAFSPEHARAEKESGIASALSVFGLTAVPTQKELTRLFHEKAKAFHPDTITSLSLDEAYVRFAEEKFSSFRQAYEILLPYAKK